MREGGSSRWTEYPGTRCGARLKDYLAVSAKQKRTSHCPMGDDVHLYREGRGWRAVVVKPNGNSGLLVDAE